MLIDMDITRYFICAPLGIEQFTGQIVLLFSYNEPPVQIQTGSFSASLRLVLNGCPQDIQHPLTHCV